MTLPPQHPDAVLSPTDAVVPSSAEGRLRKSVEGRAVSAAEQGARLRTGDGPCSKPVEVEIMGQRFTVSSEDGEEHVRRMAEYVDEQMRRATAAGAPGTTLHVALVTALNIASEYWKLAHQQKEIDLMISRIAQKILSQLDR